MGHISRTISLVFIMSAGACVAMPPFAMMSLQENTTGMVAEWKLDEGSGTNAADSSVYGWNGTISNTAWTNGLFGNKALIFNGTSSWFNAGPVTNITGYTNATVTGWVYRAATGTVMAFGNYRQPYKFSMIWFSDNNIYLETENGTSPNSSFSEVQSGWHFIAWVFDGTQSSSLARVAAYWDGVPVVTGSMSGTFPTTLPSVANMPQFRAGFDYPGANRFSGGGVDDMRIYNRGLSAAEISVLYINGPR